jgi:hypothetical protein
MYIYIYLVWVFNGVNGLMDWLRRTDAEAGREEGEKEEDEVERGEKVNRRRASRLPRHTQTSLLKGLPMARRGGRQRTRPWRGRAVGRQGGGDGREAATAGGVVAHTLLRRSCLCSGGGVRCKAVGSELS